MTSRLTPSTVLELLEIGVDPVKAAHGARFEQSDTFYEVVEFFSEQRGIKMFRVSANGKLKLLGQEQVKAIFA
jgi:hypothetical protein